MVSASIPSAEQQRLKCLHTLQILDTPPDPAIDAITRLLAERVDCPIALLSLVDEHRQWFKSRHGLDVAQTAREEAFCAHAILDNQQFVVGDAAADPRFADNPLVTGPQAIRFYAGQPLLVEGVAIGTLCVLDRAPRNWTGTQASQLAALTTIVEALLAAQWRERQALIEAARLSEFARASTSLLWECDAQLRVNWISPGVEFILGQHAGEAIGARLFDGMPLDELGRAKPGAASLHQELQAKPVRPLAGAYEVETPSGTRVLGLSITPVLGRGNVLIGWRGAARDVASSVEARRERQALEAIEERRQHQMEFMARVSHELRTPLSAILSFCHLIQRDMAPIAPPHCVRWLELVQAGGAHLVALTEDLATFCNQGQQPLQLAGVPLRRVVDETLALLQPSSAQCDVRLDAHGGDGVVVRADAQALRQVLFNVVGNAIKYSPRGGVVDVSCSQGEGAGLVEVADAGRGIPKNRLGKLFTPFERLGAETSGIPGTGLGLAISKTLIDSMEGTIHAESPARGGCVIRVGLPLVLGPALVPALPTEPTT